MTGQQPSVRIGSAQKWQDETSKNAWIAGRIETLLSHYFQPDNPVEGFEGALTDWADVLGHYSQAAIEHACGFWLRNQPRNRPTPAGISQIARDYTSNANAGTSQQRGQGDRSTLSPDDLQTLDERVLPKAREWLHISALRDHATKTLDHWGETYELTDREIRERKSQ